MAEWESLIDQFLPLPGARQLIVADIDRVQTSCGFGVPLMEPVGQRQTLLQWAKKKGTDKLQAYQQEKNATSIDGLPTPLSYHASSIPRSSVPEGNPER